MHDYVCLGCSSDSSLSQFGPDIAAGGDARTGARWVWLMGGLNYIRMLIARVSR